MRSKRMLWQLFPSYVLIIVLSLTAVTVYSVHALRGHYMDQAAEDLEARARLLASVLSGEFTVPNPTHIDSVCIGLGERTGTRFTVVLPGGEVLGDTEEDPRNMELHHKRPEIAEALAGRTGVSTRFSNTLQQQLMYVAVAVSEEGRTAAVVRAALPLTELKDEINTLTGRVVIAGLIIAALAAVLSLLISRKVTQPLEDLRRGAEQFAQGDLNYTLQVSKYEEIGGLAQAMNQMAGQLHDRIWTVVRQRNEQEAILASMVEGVLAVDTAERILTINKAAVRLFRVQPDEARGRSVQEIVRNSELHHLVAETLRSSQPVEGSIELTGNGERHLQVHGTTLRDDHGRAVGAVMVLNDITRVRRLENVRREFVANVSHELRTPITSIKGFVETLLDGALESPDEARRFLEIAARHADQLNAIIEDLLSLSRIEQGTESGGIDMHFQPVGRVVRNAIQSCAVRAGEKSVKLETEGDLGAEAMVNASLLEQALVNLIGNAITYGPAEGTVHVGAVRREGSIDIYVADSGPGIDPKHHERLFERFYRIDKGRGRTGGGTGLGLAIVKHIALAHGGRVTIDSKVGAGSTFTIHLPVPAKVSGR